MGRQRFGKTSLFLTVAAAFFILFLLVEKNNDRFLLNDFRVYYDASNELLNGCEPYGQAFGLSSGFFKYSPVSLFGFIPYHLFTFENAKLIHFLVIAFFAILCFLISNYLAESESGTELKNKSLFLIILLIASAVHLTRELHLGNINLLLVLLVLLIWLSQKNEYLLIAAFLLAVLILIKPYFLIITLVLFVKREWKTLGLMVLFMAVLVILPAFFLGYDQNITLHKQWIDIMLSHSSDMISEHTINSIIFSYSGIVLKSYWQWIWIVLICIIYLFIRRKELVNSSLTQKQMIGDFALLTALIPNLVITDSQHFLFSIPLLALILSKLFQTKSIIAITLASVLWFFYGANSNDLLGNPLSDLFDKYSTIGVANLGLIGLYIAVRMRENKIIAV